MGIKEKLECRELSRQLKKDYPDIQQDFIGMCESIKVLQTNFSSDVNKYVW